MTLWSGLAPDIAVATAVAIVSRFRPALALLLLMALSLCSISFVAGPTLITPFKVTLVLVTCFCLRHPDARAALGRPAARGLIFALLGLAVATLLTIINAQYRVPVFRETAKAIEYLLVFCTSVVCATQARKSELTTGILLITGTTAVFALGQDFGGAPSVFAEGHLLVPRIAGALEGPNQLAAYIGLALPFLLAVLPRKVGWLPAIGIFLLASAEILTFSRSGILTTLIAVVLVAILQRDLARRSLVAIGCGALTGFGIALLLAHGAVHFTDFGEAAATGGVGHRGALGGPQYCSGGNIRFSGSVLGITNSSSVASALPA